MRGSPHAHVKSITNSRNAFYRFLFLPDVKPPASPALAIQRFCKQEAAALWQLSQYPSACQESGHGRSPFAIVLELQGHEIAEFQNPWTSKPKPSQRVLTTKH